MKQEDRNDGISRRGFLKRAGLLGAALCVNPVLEKATAAERVLTGQGQVVRDIPAGMAAVRELRTLGNGTAAFRVSAMGFGCMGLNHHRSSSPDEAACIRLVREAICAGNGNKGLRDTGFRCFLSGRERWYAPSCGVARCLGGGLQRIGGLARHTALCR